MKHSPDRIGPAAQWVVGTAPFANGKRSVATSTVEWSETIARGGHLPVSK